MNRLNSLWSRLTHLLRWRHFDDDLQQEIAFHIEARADDLEQSGMSRAEALAVARRAFGSDLRMREQSREPWRFRWLDDAWLDLRYALRMLRRTPVFTVTALGTLALGIGANAAIFSIIDAAILRPLPYPDPDRLVSVLIEERTRTATMSLGPGGAKRVEAGTSRRYSPSAEDVRDWQNLGRVFSDICMWRNATPVVLQGTEPERVNVSAISETYLGVLGVTPALGRGVSAEDVREGAPPVVLIGHGFWQTRFGGDRGVIGRTVRLDDEPATIIGVLPAMFDPEARTGRTWRPYIWRPLTVTSREFDSRGSGAVVYARLRPGVAIGDAQRILSALVSRLDAARGRGAGAAVHLESLYERTVAGYSRTAMMLAAAAALILLIACANVAGLLLARGAARRPELAIRTSIGAGRARLVRQLLTESTALAVAGGAAGLLLARVSLDVLVASVPMDLPLKVTLNLRVLAFAIALSLLTSLGFGLLPAVRLSAGVKVNDALSRAAARQGSPLSRRGGQALIALEVALAVVLVAGAALMIRSFGRLLAVDLGFNPASMVTMNVAPVSPDRVVREQYYPALIRSLRSLPAVHSVGAVDNLPLGGDAVMTIAEANGHEVELGTNEFLPGYFEAAGVRLTDGRYPTDADRSSAPSAAVLSEAAARQLFHGARAVGRVFKLLGGQSFQVVGIVGDARHGGPLLPMSAEAFVPFGSRHARPLTIVVRPRPGARAIGEQLRHAAQSLGTRVVIDGIRSGSDLYADVVRAPRQRTVLLALFGGLGMIVALVGVFGVTAYAVARRTREIGVRMALGAPAGAVVRSTLRDSLWPAAIGIVAGLGGSVAATRVIASFLFETRPTDPGSLAAAAVALALAAFLAALIPARRAARVDPVAVLRAE